MNAIVGYTRKATTEILGITVPVTPLSPRCIPAHVPNAAKGMS